MYLFPYLSVLQSVEVSPQPPALNAVPPTSHRWAPTRPAEGEPDTAFAGLRAVTGESSRWYVSAALS